ncbi:hypothetical protein [Methylotetracoccus oryzae]|nr:hypothetical protein [Methylotetracoccus oryzae]
MIIVRPLLEAIAGRRAKLVPQGRPEKADDSGKIASPCFLLAAQLYLA